MLCAFGSSNSKKAIDGSDWYYSYTDILVRCDRYWVRKYGLCENGINCSNV